MKAAFVYNFVRFVEWPESSVGAEGLVIGVLKDNEFGEHVSRIVAGKTVGGHPIQVRSFDDSSSLVGCHVLFVGASASGEIDAILTVLSTQHVLTVSHLEDFAAQGGIIGFYKSDNKLRFRINVNAARHAGIKISSKLLDLAEIIEGPVGPQRD